MKINAIFFDKPLSYKDGLLIQESIIEARIKDLVPDTVLFLEHLPVITCGVRTKPEQILLSARELKAKRIELAPSSRGGAVTFHGPGQLVMYPIIKLEGNRLDVHSYLHNLEKIAIRTAACFGIRAYRRKGMTGAWTDQGKLAAIGIRFKRWVAYHGMSFNVNPDLSGFSAIIPCGLRGEKVTSLKLILGNKCPSLKKVRAAMANQFRAVFDRELLVLHRKQFCIKQLPSLLITLEKFRPT
jgi:lipoate-protein ligase B